MSNGASLVLSETIRIVTLIASLVIKSEASFDDAPSRLVSEGFVAGDAVVLAVVVASWSLLDALLFLRGVEVSIHALDASSILVHLLAELVL